MSDLQAVVYVSSASQLMTSPQLEALVAEASELNRQNSITGVLLYSEGTFMQYFEGPELAMRATYQRIRDSRRHRGIIELLSERIDIRSFSDWQMGFSQATPPELWALSSASWQSNGEAASVIPAGLWLLQGFWGRHARLPRADA